MKRQRWHDPTFQQLRVAAKQLCQAGQHHREELLRHVQEIGRQAMIMKGRKITSSYCQKQPEKWLTGRLVHLDQSDNRQEILSAINNAIEELQNRNPVRSKCAEPQSTFLVAEKYDVELSSQNECSM